jgi:hypothetical protein
VISTRLRWTVWIASGLVTLTGLPLLWVGYLAAPEADESVPAFEATALHLHVLAAPLLVFVLGASWSAHVQPHLAAGTKERRRSGIALLAFSLVAIASGYACQVTVADSWRAAAGWTHVISSALWAALLIAHFTCRRQPSP